MSERYVAGLDMVKLFWAFPPHIRKMIGYRDKWHCQEDGCERSYQGGYMVEIHHIKGEAEARKEGWSEAEIQSPENGETLCLPHHHKIHIENGDWDGARLIEERIKRSGIHHHGYVLYERKNA